MNIFVHSAETQISLRICAVWSESFWLPEKNAEDTVPCEASEKTGLCAG